ncbi:MAG: hypothetical protein O2971_07530 [Proteobacteria bacterium]|nr:hypothetical protein [Pseudomonadota bacterium]
MISVSSINLLKTPANCGSQPIRSWKNTAASVSRSGTSASNCTNKPFRFWHRLGLLWVGACLLPATLFAQEPSPDTRIDSVTTTLTELDKKAETCLNSLNRGTTDEARSHCDEFLQAIDGELLASYLKHCEALRSWRDDFVSASTADNTPNNNNSEENLQRLVGIEFACGENALNKRTEYVVSAFSLLQDGQIKNQRASAALTRRLAELQLQSTAIQERRLLQNSILQQQSQRQLETEQLWNDLELELIRQQIRNPSAAFPRNQ